VCCQPGVCPHGILLSCTLCRYYELKCKHCSDGKVGDIKTTESGVKLYPRMYPDCGILYKVGPYVISGRVTVDAKPAASIISGTSSHNSDSQVFARLFVFAQAVCPAVCPATVVNLVFQGSAREKNTYKFESDKVLLYRKRLQGGPHVRLYCCILRLSPTGCTGVHISINSTTSGPVGAPVLYGAPRVPQAMRPAVKSYFEAGAGPMRCQNLLRLCYKDDHFSFMQIPSHAVLRNFLRHLRKQNPVLAHNVPMTGPGERRPASNLPNADVSGVPLGSLDEPPLELGANMVVGELKAFCEGNDFKVWLSARDQSVPPL
jgi:hypothetical protein